MDDLDQASRALASTSTRDPKAPQASDPRSTSELVSLYLCNPETDEAGQALGIVQYRGGKAEFEIAAQLAQSSLAHERRVAADILAQLGWQERTYLSESIEILLRLLNESEEAQCFRHQRLFVAIARILSALLDSSNWQSILVMTFDME